MLIGRKAELEILNGAFRDDVSRFIAVYGRRRIGKTFLIRECFNDRFTFQHSGLSSGSMKEQLFAFGSSLKDAGYRISHTPKSWLEAFEDLKDLIRQSTEKRKVIFIDELSWLDTPKSGLMTALENFWNGWASARKDIVLIICASATSWIISKVIHNKGGLYHRLTDTINLKPFSLSECEEMAKEMGLVLNRLQILQGYMIFGGVPYYWGLLKKGQSLSQNIDRLCFAEDALLKDEYKYLYASVFKNPDVHIRIVETLAEKKAGMTREEIIRYANLANSGDISLKLEELESSGFIRKYTAYGKKSRDAVYQLIDFFTLFYYRFMKGASDDPAFWSDQLNTPKLNTWNGLAFERVCMMHMHQIKKTLGISGILTETHSWYCKADKDKGISGSQIDMVIVRKDQVIDICEMKYSDCEYTVTEKVDYDIKKKIHDFSRVTGTRYAVHPILITTYGLIDNSYSKNFQSVVTMGDMFEN